MYLPNTVPSVLDVGFSVAGLDEFSQNSSLSVSKTIVYSGHGTIVSTY